MGGGVTNLLRLLIFAILHRVVDMADDGLERIRRREIERQKRHQRVVFDEVHDSLVERVESRVRDTRFLSARSREEQRVGVQVPERVGTVTKSNTDKGHLAMSFLRRMPFLAPDDGSSVLAVTRSILDMMLIQGISRFTIADMADSTPLRIKMGSGKCGTDEE